jgi:carbon monoxide dehydrogenase subunit G
MRVELTGSFAVAAPVEQVWGRLMDPAFVASCAPGVESVEGIDDTHYRVKTLLGVGSVQLRFSMLLELADLVPPRSARMVVHGTATGSALKADSSVRLAVEDHHTRVDWTVGSDVRGTIASTGARLLKGTARKLTEQFWKTFAHRVTKPAPAR